MKTYEDYVLELCVRQYGNSMRVPVDLVLADVDALTAGVCAKIGHSYAPTLPEFGYPTQMCLRCLCVDVGFRPTAGTLDE